MATSKISTAKRGHNSPLSRVKVGTLRSICQRAVMRREKSASSEMISTVGVSTGEVFLFLSSSFSVVMFFVGAPSVQVAGPRNLAPSLGYSRFQTRGLRQAGPRALQPAQAQAQL